MILVIMMMAQMPIVYNVTIFVEIVQIQEFQIVAHVRVQIEKYLVVIVFVMIIIGIMGQT